MNRFIAALRRVATWLRRNPSARADALELAAASLMERAATVANLRRRSRMQLRAALFRERAIQLRERG